jgi:hypothetical protein
MPLSHTLWHYEQQGSTFSLNNTSTPAEITSITSKHFRHLLSTTLTSIHIILFLSHWHSYKSQLLSLKQTKQQALRLLVCKQTILTEEAAACCKPFANFFWVEGCCMACTTDPTAINLRFLGPNSYFSIQGLLNYPREAEWTPSQTHYYSENLIAPGIEPRSDASVAKNSDH